MRSNTNLIDDDLSQFMQKHATIHMLCCLVRVSVAITQCPVDSVLMISQTPDTTNKY